MLQTLRERLTLLLIWLLPFHALLVTVGTKLIDGPGHAPNSILALWKEGLLGLILLIACIEAFKKRNILDSRFSILNSDAIDWLILALILLSLLVGPIVPDGFANYLFGFRYDFVPLIAFLILRRVPWSGQFQARAMSGLLMIGTIVAVFGIISLLLPQTFFTVLGYSDLHSLYVPSGPIAPFQQIGGLGLRRVQSTLSGPNQLGIWLVIPISISLIQLLHRNNQRETFKRSTFNVMSLLLFLLALFLTFSRSAWIAATIVAIVILYRSLPRPIFWHLSLAVGVMGIIAGIAAASLAPGVLLRAASSRGHIEKPLAALRLMAEQPLGKGLGTAGPASNRISDACVHLEPGSDPTWAKDQSQLCVFVGDQQVQPADRTCDCPVLTENWYLQIGVELGWIGLILFVALIVSIGRRLIVAVETRHAASLPPTTFLIFLGVSTAALFLHAWEDTAVAYTVWILAAWALPVAPSTKAP